MLIYPFPRLLKLRTHLKTRLKEKGSVLWMILIAVALFAALAYAVTQSTRSGGGDASKETATLQASQITQYGTELQTAIMRMKISNNCTDEQISFENPIVSGYTNPNSPVNYTCHVFRPEGGNVTFKKPPQGANDGSDYIFTGYNSLVYVGTFNGGWAGGACMGGGSCNELIMFLKNVPKDLCLELNKKLSVPERSTNNPPQDVNSILFDKFFGSYNAQNGIEDFGNILVNQMTACIEGHIDPPAGTYHFYHTLIPR